MVEYLPSKQTVASSSLVVRFFVAKIMEYETRTPQDKVLSEFERGASRVRSAFVKRTQFFETKHEDTFHASDSRQSRRPLHKKEPLKGSFLFV